MREGAVRLPGSGLPLNPEGRYLPAELRDLSDASEVESALEHQFERARFRVYELATVHLRTTRDADGYYHWTASPRGEARGALQELIRAVMQGPCSRGRLWDRTPSPAEAAAGRYHGFLVRDPFGPEPETLEEQNLLGLAEVDHGPHEMILRVYRDTLGVADPPVAMSPEELAEAWSGSAPVPKYARVFQDPECRIEEMLLDLFRDAGLEHALRETGAPGYEGCA